MKNKLEGTFLYKNWIAKINNEPLKCTYEYPFFSDYELTGELTDNLIPYYLINTVATKKINNISPVLIFRADIHIDVNIKNMEKTDTSTYHGGNLNDEMAALLSLCLGIRVKSGGSNRCFYLELDPKGRPEYLNLNDDPIFFKRNEKCIIPYSNSKYSINDAKDLISFPKLEPENAIVLIKSARLYQEALWLSESEPALSWLLFVSAIETAANFWMGKELPPIEKLEYFNSNLYKILLDKDDKELLEKVAKEISDYMGSTKKFVDFIINFLPEMPKNRPKEKYRLFEWEDDKIKKSLKTIYKLRSNALHSGIPFPAPMCIPPKMIDGTYSEIPIGFSTQMKDSVWTIKDTPMLLHLFEYITRCSLLKWWQSMI